MNQSKNYSPVNCPNFENECINLTPYECERKCNLSKLTLKYKKELELNKNLKTNLIRIKYPIENDGISPLNNSEHMKLKNQINESNIKLQNIVNSLKENIENENNILRNKNNKINYKNNIIYQNKNNLNDLNIIINNLRQEILSNQDKLSAGKERNYYKRNIILFLSILIIILILVVANTGLSFIFKNQ